MAISANFENIFRIYSRDFNEIYRDVLWGDYKIPLTRLISQKHGNQWVGHINHYLDDQYRAMMALLFCILQYPLKL